jgi:hypothetical protein
VMLHFFIIYISYCLPFFLTFVSSFLRSFLHSSRSSFFPPPPPPLSSSFLPLCVYLRIPFFLQVFFPIPTPIQLPCSVWNHIWQMSSRPCL